MGRQCRDTVLLDQGIPGLLALGAVYTAVTPLASHLPRRGLILGEQGRRRRPERHGGRE
mgnify:CR=1 FL=1